MATIYILFSNTLNKLYVGSCLNLEKRLVDHKNKTYSTSFTSVADDWQLYLAWDVLDGDIVRKIEFHSKSMKSKKYIENLKNYPEMREKLIKNFPGFNIKIASLRQL